MLGTEENDNDIFGLETLTSRAASRLTPRSVPTRRSRRIVMNSATPRGRQSRPSSTPSLSGLHISATDEDVANSVIYDGEFCVYAMSDSVLRPSAPGLLRRVLSTFSFSSNTSIITAADYPSLYHKIRALDGDSGASGSDIRAHLTLHPTRSNQIGEHNKFWELSNQLLDAYLADMHEVDDVLLASGSRQKGLVAKLTLPKETVGVDTCDGELTVARVWSGDLEGEVEELFEGRFRWRVQYSAEAWSEGYGEGVDCDFGFWAVRANEA